MPRRVESFKVDCSKNIPRARFTFDEPIRNRLRKEQNLIESRSFRVETGLVGRQNGVGPQKEK